MLKQLLWWKKESDYDLSLILNDIQSILIRLSEVEAQIRILKKRSYFKKRKKDESKNTVSHMQE